ncbi:Zinc finger protein Gfi-1b [Homalodisca vitripennis]|nr:Zinc finger protein Gfi-1b [Homalodisca vitripennis]
MKIVAMLQEVELMTDTAQLQRHRKFVCGVCSEVYRSLGRIAYHAARCHAGPYQCELCVHVATTKQLLNRHKKKCHKGVESFFCTECGLGFKRRTSLQKHLVNRHESGQDHFVCDIDGCSQLFPKKIHLTNHKIEVHGMERKFLCQVCGHKFMTQDSLSRHLEFHTNKKRFECRICSKLFATNEKLTFHVRTHTGEKPFVCDRLGCTKSFVSKAKLTEHLQRHNGEKRHKCPVCGKQYANKPDLRIHLRKIHPSGENSVETAPADSECIVATPDLPRVEQHPEPSGVDMYPSSLILQVDNPGSQLYNSMQFYQEPLQMVRSVTVPQSVVITSYETVMGM